MEKSDGWGISSSNRTFACDRFSKFAPRFFTEDRTGAIFLGFSGAREEWNRDKQVNCYLFVCLFVCLFAHRPTTRSHIVITVFKPRTLSGSIWFNAWQIVSRKLWILVWPMALKLLVPQGSWWRLLRFFLFLNICTREARQDKATFILQYPKHIFLGWLLFVQVNQWLNANFSFKYIACYMQLRVWREWQMINCLVSVLSD